MVEESVCEETQVEKQEDVCIDVQEKIIGLTEKRASFEAGIEKIDDLKSIFSEENDQTLLDEIRENAMEKKKQVDQDIDKVFEKMKATCEIEGKPIEEIENA